MSKSKELLSELTDKDESVKELQLVFSGSSKSIPSKEFFEISDLSYNGILIEPKSTDVPLAWDASFDIKGSDMIITGAVGESGFGNVTIKLPVSKVSSYYKIYVEPKDDLKAKQIQNILDLHGIKVK